MERLPTSAFLVSGGPQLNMFQLLPGVVQCDVPVLIFSEFSV
jgi:hypothetical protein